MKPDFDAAAFLRLAGRALLDAEPGAGPPASVFREEAALLTWVIDRVERGSTVKFPHLIGDEFTLVTVKAAADLRRARAVLREAFELAPVSPARAVELAESWKERVPDLKSPIARNWAGRLPERVFRIYARQHAQNRLGYVYLHLRAYRDRNGHWPQSLPPGMPLDPFTGRSFGYDGKYLWINIPDWDTSDSEILESMVRGGSAWRLKVP